MVLGMPTACLPSRARRPERREGEHMRILALTHVVPNPPDAGPKIKTHYALRMLAREHQIELLTFARDERERAAAEALQSWCARVTIIALQRRKIREPLYLASGWLRGQPYLVARDYRLSLAAAVRARLAEGGIDVVHADQLAMAQYLPLAERAGVATVFDAHNAVYDLIRDMSKRPPTPLHRPALGLEWRLLRRYEGMLSRRSARTLTVSSHDHTPPRGGGKRAGARRDRPDRRRSRSDRAAPDQPSLDTLAKYRHHALPTERRSPALVPRYRVANRARGAAWHRD